MKQPQGIALRLAPETNFDQLKDMGDTIGSRVAVRLEAGPITLEAFHNEFAAELAGAYTILQLLWSSKALQLLNKLDQPDLCVAPIVVGEILDLGFPQANVRWKLSRFAHVRRHEDGLLTIETPRSCLRANILRSCATRILFDLLTPVTASQMAESCDWLRDEAEARDVLSLLQLAGIAEPCDDDGKSAEDLCHTLMQWEFHDLLFHNRSRMGRHDGSMGAHFRFKGKLEHQPSIKPNPWLKNGIPLYRPSSEQVALHDPPFSYVLESRRSNRSHNQLRPISAETLGEFLFRAARNRYHYTTEIGTFTSRPYPSGGGSYELELYLTINQCSGLQRGFYYYDPEHHNISLIEGANEDMERMLYDSWISSARSCWPQVLIIIASRFQRVSWKYSGMAYATQLKNTGVLFQTFYLVATAMNLAGCALGLGNTARFCKLAQTDFFAEGSIGEFMLGSSA